MSEDSQEFPKTAFEQKVLPETISGAIESSYYMFHPKLVEGLQKHEWTAIEHRELPSLPNINILLAKEGKDQNLGKTILKRMEITANFLGYEK